MTGNDLTAVTGVCKRADADCGNPWLLVIPGLLTLQFKETSVSTEQKLKSP
jgi:hypothetical protein